MSLAFICSNFTSDQVLQMASSAFLYLSRSGVSKILFCGTAGVSVSLEVFSLSPNRSQFGSPSPSSF